MGYSTPDVYYQPEGFGLEPFGEVDVAGSYEFDIIAVWRHKETGRLYWGADSGCSCPSPFESTTALESLKVLPETLLELEAALKGHRPYCYGSDDDTPKDQWHGESLALFTKVRDALA